MCPHPTNPHRLPQPHLLSEWQPSQDHYAADHHAQPTNAPGKASISERSARAPALSEKSPYPLSCRLTGTTGTVARATPLPPGGSGTRPKRALEANKPPPRAQRESPILSEASSARAGRVPRSPTVQQATRAPALSDKSPYLLSRRLTGTTGTVARATPLPRAAAGSGRSEPWRRTNHPLAHSAKAPSFQKPPQPAQAESRGAPPCSKPHGPKRFRISRPTPWPPDSNNRHRRPGDTIATGRQRDTAEASLGGEQTTPSRTARKPHPFGSLLSPRRPSPAEPHHAASPFKPDLSPQKAKQTITPHRLFEKRTSRRTNPWTAIV